MEIYILSYGWAIWSAHSHPWASPFCTLKLWVLKGRVRFCFCVCTLCRKVHEGVLGHLGAEEAPACLILLCSPPELNRTGRVQWSPWSRSQFMTPVGANAQEKGNGSSIVSVRHGLRLSWPFWVCHSHLQLPRSTDPWSNGHFYLEAMVIHWSWVTFLLRTGISSAFFSSNDFAAPLPNCSTLHSVLLAI